MTVNSREEAWKEADRLFPTDYEKDEEASRNAGYPIYRSTRPGENSWISDLNTTIELSIQQGKGIKTVRINIRREPEITEKAVWSSEKVRECCVKNDLYTVGTIKDYEKMLSTVEESEPTKENIYRVAKDILEHSDDQTITNIMFLLSREAVNRFYEVAE